MHASGVTNLEELRKALDLVATPVTQFAPVVLEFDHIDGLHRVESFNIRIENGSVVLSGEAS